MRHGEEGLSHGRSPIPFESPPSPREITTSGARCSRREALAGVSTLWEWSPTMGERVDVGSRCDFAPGRRWRRRENRCRHEN